MVRRRDRGFTMIELLISMALASLGLAGLLALQVTAMRGNTSSREFVEAVGVAQAQLETVEVASYPTLSLLAEGTCTQPNTAITGNYTNVSVTGSPTIYTRCTQVNAGANTTYVKVVVQWTDNTINTATAQPHWVTVETTRSP